MFIPAVRSETQQVKIRGLIVLRLGQGGIARPFSTQIISVNRDVKQISVGFKKVTVEASEMTVGYMTV